jgi:hypothetical protein
VVKEKGLRSAQLCPNTSPTRVCMRGVRRGDGRADRGVAGGSGQEQKSAWWWREKSFLEVLSAALRTPKVVSG